MSKPPPDNTSLNQMVYITQELVTLNRYILVPVAAYWLCVSPLVVYGQLKTKEIPLKCHISVGIYRWT